MGWDSFGVVLQVWDGKQATGNHGLGIFLCGRI